MPNISKHAKVICPFFSGGERNYLCCESSIPGTWLRYMFHNNAMCDRWMDKYCCTREWGECPYAKMLGWKYDGEE